MRWFKNETTGKWSRHEPWMSTIVDVGSGQVLGFVDGRDSSGVGAWLKAQPSYLAFLH